MTHSIDKKATSRKEAEKKVKIALPAGLLQAAAFRAEQEGQSLEDWLLCLVERQLQSKDPVQPLDWGRIDSRIDQRTTFLEHRIDVLSERIDLLLKQQLPEKQQSPEKQQLPQQPPQAELLIQPEGTASCRIACA